MTHNENAVTALDIATLPLADGRQVAVPLLALAEVQQYVPAEEGEEGLGSVHWRGQELKVQSLEEFCGLPAQAADAVRTVGIFRARHGSKEPFRALAFCGLAAHRRIVATEMVPAEKPQEGIFSAAAMLGEETYLIPDLPRLLYN